MATVNSSGSETAHDWPVSPRTLSLAELGAIDHERYMREALREAERAMERGDMPIGSVVVHFPEEGFPNGRIVGRGGNSRFSAQSRLTHAEIEALRSAEPEITEIGRECIIYTTVEPYVMCLGAIVMANVRHVVFALADRHIYPDRFSTDESRNAMNELVPYVRARSLGYRSGVLEAESLALHERYSPEHAALILGR